MREKKKFSSGAYPLALAIPRVVMVREGGPEPETPPSQTLQLQGLRNIAPNLYANLYANYPYNLLDTDAPESSFLLSSNKEKN